MLQRPGINVGRNRWTTTGVATLLVLVCALIAAREADAAVTAVVVGPDLQPQPINLQSIGGGLITYFDSDRQLQARPIDSVLQVRRIGGQEVGRAPTEPEGSVLLTDGQRVAGRWSGGTDDGQTVRWVHPMLGRVEVGLDRVAEIRTSAVGAADLSPAGLDADRIVLANGDALLGYVRALEKEAVLFQAGARDQPMHLPIARIRAVSMINPPADSPSGGYMVWMVDGSRFAARAVGVAGGDVVAEVELLATGGSVTLPLSALARIDFPAASNRLVPMTRLPAVVDRSADVFGLVVPPRIDGRSIYLHAPTIVGYELPARSARLGVTVRLEDGSDRRWADVRVVFRNNGAVIKDVQLSAEHPEEFVNVGVTQGALTIELDEGANGPVQDNVELRDLSVLLGQ